MTYHLSPNAIQVLRARYLQRDASGQIIESPEQLFRRVAESIATAELAYGTRQSADKWAENFHELLSQQDFLPNSPTLMNAGTKMGQLSGCFVLPIGDNDSQIFDSLKLAARIQQSGGGTGFAFSRVRPKGQRINLTDGESPGPIAFMRIFDAMTENIRQSGKRRGANMGVLVVSHADILEFINVKRDGHSLPNFNLSIAVPDDFMQAVQSRDQYVLSDPGTGEQLGSRDAGELFQDIVEAAWQTGDPGLLFIDAMNRANPTPQLGPFEATNPCGEVPLLPYEPCNLGSINLPNMLRKSARRPVEESLDWDKLATTSRIAIRLLDDVIDINHWPSPAIRKMAIGNRKIGLGVMGFADMLIRLGIPFASRKAVSVAEELMSFIAGEAAAESQKLAEERGVFPNWPKSTHAEQGRRTRNATLTSIAPTGTISIIADSSPGIEPLFALAYRRQHVLNDQTLVEINPRFVDFVKEHSLYSRQLMRRVRQSGTLQSCDAIPSSTRTLFQTAIEIAPQQHLDIMAAFQKHVDNAVSKTINLPRSAPVQQIADIYQQAWKMGLKGVTVYRYGSKSQEVLKPGLAEGSQDSRHSPDVSSDPSSDSETCCQ